MKLPKFLYSEVNTPKFSGIFVVHTQHPRCVGKVVDEDGKTRVYMHEKWEDMDSDQELSLCLKMKNWVYFGRKQQEGA